MNSEIHGSSCASFQIVGTLESKRPVTSDKQKDWKLYLLKYAIPGSTLEVEVSSEEFERGVIESAYCITGKIAKDGKFMKLIAQSIKPASEVRPLPRNPSV